MMVCKYIILWSDLEANECSPVSDNRLTGYYDVSIKKQIGAS